MPADPCLVTVRAGPGASKGYENFVSNKLQDEVLKEIESNLQDDLKEEALIAFKETVSQGWSIKDCICKVQNEVLPKVPNERNKFFIKFTYDNQLQIEIGVNKFKNGNAQFYHRIGMAPKECPEVKEQKDEKVKRKEVMEELSGDGSCPVIIRLKKQTSNDRSAPFISGKVSNPGGGWDDVPDTRTSIPPNPTNIQTALACTGWTFDPPCETKASRRRVLGALFRTKKPGVSGLRSRSVGRTLQDYKDDRASTRHRSVSPPKYMWTESGSPFELAGILRSKARLKPAGGHTVHRGSFKTGRRFSLTKNSNEDDTKNTHVGIYLEREHRPYDGNEEDFNNLKYSSSSLDTSEGENSIIKDKKEDLLKTQKFQKEEEVKPWHPVQDKSPENEEADGKNVWFIKNIKTEETYKRSHRCDLECDTITEPYSEQLSLHCGKEFELPDLSLFEKKIQPLPPLEQFSQWYTSVSKATNTTTPY